MKNQFPFYNDETDFNTNASSYYKDLARKNKLFKYLAEKIWEYNDRLDDGLNDINLVLEQILNIINEGFNDEINKLLIKWVEDGTLDFIINETLMNEKADKSELIDLENTLNDLLNNLVTEIETELDLFKGDLEETMNHLESELLDVLNSLENDFNNHINEYNSLEVKPLELIAHRGFLNLAPENTMTAFTLAHNIGADSLECDVHITSDGVPVIIHDNTVNRTTTGTGSVNSFTFNQIQQLDAGSKYGGELFNTSRIPSFEEFLIFSKGRTKMIYPEIKGIRSLSDIEIIIDLIKLYDMEKMTCIQSFDFNHLVEVRKYSNDINFGFLTSNEPSETQYNIMENDGNCSLLGNYNLFLGDSSIVKKCYSKTIEVGTWTVDAYDILEKLLKIGVYKIMSNNFLGGVRK